MALQADIAWPTRKKQEIIWGCLSGPRLQKANSLLSENPCENLRDPLGPDKFLKGLIRFLRAYLGPYKAPQGPLSGLVRSSKAH